MAQPLLLLALAQGALPTVGDTVWAARTVVVPAGMTVRARPLPARSALEPLGPPVVTLRGGTALLRYPVAVWRPGRHAVELPGPILVRGDGWSDTLPALQVAVEVGSVLPPGRRDTLPPRPPAAVLVRPERSLVPAGLLGLAALILLLPFAWWRRGPRRPVGAPPAPAPVPDPATLVRWLEQGETRAALDGWRSAIEQRAQGSEAGAAHELAARLEAARYAPADSTEVAGLVAQLHRGGGRE